MKKRWFKPGLAVLATILITALIVPLLPSEVSSASEGSPPLIGDKEWVNTWTEVEYLGGGKYGSTLYSGHQVFFDESDNGKPKKHKLTDNLPDYVVVQSAKICAEIHPFYTTYYDVQYQEVRVEEERWIVQRKFKEPDTWRDVDRYNPVLTVEEDADALIVTIVYDTDYGILTVEYLQRDGSALKHNVYFQNTSESTQTFRVLQKWTGIAGSKVNGKNMPVVTQKDYLTFHDSNKPAKEFTVSENLYSMIFNPDGTERTGQCLQLPISIDTSANGLKVDFIYGNWTLPINGMLEIDPDTTTLNNPTEDGFIHTFPDNRHPADNTIRYGRSNATLGPGMQTSRGYVEWNISGIDDASTISKAEFRYEGEVHSVNATNTDVNAMASQPSVSADAVVYADIIDGTAYLDNNAVYPEVGANRDIGGATGPAWDNDPSSDVEANLGVDWFAIGMSTQESEVPGIAEDWMSSIYAEESTPTPSPTLYLEHFIPPPPPPPQDPVWIMVVAVPIVFIGIGILAMLTAVATGGLIGGVLMAGILAIILAIGSSIMWELIPW